MSLFNADPLGTRTVTRQVAQPLTMSAEPMKKKNHPAPTDLKESLSTVMNNNMWHHT